MNDKAVGFWFIMIILCSCLGFVCGVIFGFGVVNEETHSRAVRRGAAEYTTDSGTFKWTDDRVRFIVEGVK